MSIILNLEDARNQANTWKSKVFEEFYSVMLSKDKKFPCIFGTAGLKKQQVRYFFSESPSDNPDIASLSEALRSYIKNSRQCGKNTSLIVFFKPSNHQHSLQDYELDFWNILNLLNNADSSNWPKEISKDPEHYLWEFSFAGEPIFVVCNNPAHKLRKSRYASTFIITFQPRWIFDSLQHPAGQKLKKAVREILKTYDDISTHPSLGTYGDKNNKEWLQYYLSDSNDTNSKKCPFEIKEK